MHLTYAVVIIILLSISACASAADEGPFVGIYNYSYVSVFAAMTLITPATNVDFEIASEEYLIDRLSSTPDNYSVLVISNSSGIIFSNVSPNISSSFSYSEEKFTSFMYYMDIND